MRVDFLSIKKAWHGFLCSQAHAMPFLSFLGLLLICLAMLYVLANVRKGISEDELCEPNSSVTIFICKGRLK